jgi:hypothetical protein
VRLASGHEPLVPDCRGSLYPRDRSDRAGPQP